MNKPLTFALVLVVIAGTLTMSGLVWAEDGPPSSPQYSMAGSACQPAAGADQPMFGRMHGLTGPHQPGRMMCAADSPMQTVMHNVLAAGLGLTTADFDNRLAAGQSPAQMAAELGLSREAFYDLMQAAHTAAWASTSESQAPGGGMMRPWHARPMGPQRETLPMPCPLHAG